MRSKLAYSIVMLFVSPALVAISGIRSRDKSYQKWALILFITFFGSVITLSTSDGSIHLDRVYQYYLDMSFYEFVDITLQILRLESVEGTKGDLYIHFMSYVSGGIFGAPALFFVFVSFIYAYFYISSLLLVLRKYTWKRSYWVYIFTFFFVIWKGVEGINTVRTWTGAWVLFYGTWMYFSTKKWKYLILVGATPFIHVAYYVMSLPAWGVIVLGSRPKLYALIYGISFFTSINNNFLLTNLSTSEVGENRVAGYYKESDTSLYSLREGGSSNLYVRLGKRGTNFWAINALATLIIIYFFFWGRLRPQEEYIFAVGILLVSLANLTTYIPALFNRTMALSGIYIVGTVTLMLMSNELRSQIKWKQGLITLTLLTSVVFLIPFSLFRMSGFLQFCSAYMLALPFVPWIIEDANLSLRELIAFFI